MLRKNILRIFSVLLFGAILGLAGPGWAQDVASLGVEDKIAALTQAMTDQKVVMDTIWTLVTAFLVFWMNAGFALVESGFCRAKNAVNILSKNFIVFAASTMAFYFVGWGFMFGDGNGFLGLKGLFFLSGLDNSPAAGAAYSGVYSALSWTGIPLNAKFFFSLCLLVRPRRSFLDAWLRGSSI